MADAPKELEVVPQTLVNGKQTVKRADGAVWMDADKGFDGSPGWYTQEGQRAPDATPLRWQTLVNGQTTVKREDGAVWMDESKGFQGASGWYTKEGQKAPDKVLSKGTLAENIAFNPVTMGITDLPVKLAQVISRFNPASGMVPAYMNQPAQAIDRFVQERQKAFERLPMNQSAMASVNRAMANPANYIPAIGPVTGGAISAMAEPVTSGELAEETLKQGAIGGATSGIVSGLLNAGVKGITKAYNASKGNFAPAVSEFMRNAESLGITEYTADQALKSKGPTSQVANMLRDIPLLGDRGKLRKGLEQLATKAQSVDAKLAQEAANLGYANADDLATAAASGDRNAARLVNRMTNSSDDMNRVIQTSLDTELAARKASVGKLYDQIRSSMATTGDADVSFSRQYIQDILDREASSLAPNQNIVSELKSLASRMDDANVPKSWSNLRKADSDLGAKAKGFAGNDDAAASVLGDVREVIRHDMNQHVIASGKRPAIDALNQANKEYAEKIVPFKDKSIRGLIESTEPDATVRRMLNTPGFSDRAQKVYNMLDPKGQAAFRYTLFHDALEKASSGDKFSPAKLATELEKHMSEIGVTFKGKDLAEIKGLANVMRQMENTTLADAQVQNGKQAVKWLVPAVAGGAAVKGGAAAAAPIVGFGMLAKWLTQGSGKKYLLAASTLPPGSPQLDKLVKVIASKAPRIPGQMAGNAQTDNEVTP
jgi:hypothetical protein